MWDTLSKADPEALGAFAIYSLVAITIIAVTGMKIWRGHQREKMDTELKMDMVARGMSADEIERVLKAKSDGATSSETADDGKRKSSWW